MSSPLDHPEVTQRLFHPRPDPQQFVETPKGTMFIPVGRGVMIGGRSHLVSRRAPTLLFFHGNGEIVADYDELAPLYGSIELNFVVVDYRGYGRSSGQPSASAMLEDAHSCLAFVRRLLEANEFDGPLVVMGRSLGSACALELAAEAGDAVGALVLESAFAHSLPLLRLLGVPVEQIGLEEEHGFGNLDKAARWAGPLLVIHAERDQLIPFSNGQALYEISPSADKRLLSIPNAGHNDILLHGLREYMRAVHELCDGLG